MCGRYSFAPDLKIVNEHYEIKINDGDIDPNYNCAPTQLLPIIRNHSPHQVTLCKWGLIPFWAKDAAIGNKLINARGETLSQKASFRTPFRGQRCLVPADAFYEWKKMPGSKEKIPYRIFLRNQKVFSMAGIWDQWKNSKGETLISFSIITTTPNELMAEIHQRMPVILNPSDEKTWLMSTDQNLVQSLIKPFSANKMDAYRISTLVNSPRNNSSQIMAPYSPPPADQTI